jgi:hypothetical protein
MSNFPTKDVETLTTDAKPRMRVLQVLNVTRKTALEFALHVSFVIGFCSVAPCQELAWQEKLPSPPKELADLIERGQVNLRFYDMKPSDQRFDGETRFQYDVKYRFRFRPQGSGPSGSSRATVAIRAIKVLPQNNISVPKSYAHDKIWTDPLIVHEFEHVQINSDPRLFLLLRAVVASIRTVSLDDSTRVGGEAPAFHEQLVSQKIDEEINRRVAAVTALVQANNDLLDQVTRHGVAAEYRDANFFKRLYTEQNLKDQNFPYTDSLKVLLRSRRYTRYARADDAEEAEKQENAKGTENPDSPPASFPTSQSDY